MKTTRVLVQILLLMVAVASLLFFRNEIGDFIVGLRTITYGFFGPNCNIQNFALLEAENKSLKKEISLLSAQSTLKNKNGELIARVYSSYPFNDKVRIIVDKGSDDGITTGMPVFFDKHIVIGKVVTVKKMQSEVQTIFDSDWKTSVAIGTSTTKAVLKGGNYPEIQFIPKDSVVSVGDDVVSIAPEFPMGAIIGKIKTVSEDEKKIWQIATIEMPITLDVINQVTILTRFP